MTTIKEIYSGAFRLINELLRRELDEQGHRLTGALEDSLDAEQSKDGADHVLTGTAALYAKFVQDGFPAQSATMKQFPFVYRYFLQRGLEDSEAKRAAAATIRTWMNQGMPSVTSKAFSKTGSRTDFARNAFVGAQPRIDEYITNSLDFVVEGEFQKTKTETV